MSLKSFLRQAVVGVLLLVADAALRAQWSASVEVIDAFIVAVEVGFLSFPVAFGTL